MEATNSSLKQQLQELQEKLENSQVEEQSVICALTSQLSACTSELDIEAGEKERIKAEMEILKGKHSHTNENLRMRQF